MQKNNRQPKQQPQKPDQSFRRNLNWGTIIWIVVIFIMIFYLSRMFSPSKSTEISYTEFKQQVKKGNITEITVKGQKISGEFKGRYVKTIKEDTVHYSKFNTVMPSFDDSKLIGMLENNDVKINAETEDNAWVRILLFILLPWILIIGFFVYIRRRMQGQMKGGGGGFGGIFGVGKSRAKRYEKSSVDVTYKDVAGLENSKKDMQEVVSYLKEPEKYKKLGAEVPRGLLLIGPPGTGKTLLAKATAGEADVPFFSISGSEFIEMFVGVGASRVRDMFQNAKQEAPSIIFIDELDSIGRSRGTGLGGGHDEREQTLNQILSEMDGFSPHETVIVLAATNRPDVLDTALVRPGRFDRRIVLELPQKKARTKILQIHIRDVPVDKDVDLDRLASMTVGFSGADLRNLVNEAALLAGRKDRKKVKMGDFDQARDKIILGVEREEMMDDEEKKMVAYHEAGHTLIAKLTPKSDPLQKVTIIPRGRALGATEQAPEEDRHNFKKSYLLNRLTVMLGGRAAEKLIYNELSNGAAGDLKQVTKLARQMITQWGMSERLGPVTFSIGEDHMFLGKELSQPKDFSEDTARIIDEEIQKMVTQTEERAIKILKDNIDSLKRLAEALFEHETLSNEEIEEILDFKKEKQENEEIEKNRKNTKGKKQREKKQQKAKKNRNANMKTLEV